MTTYTVKPGDTGTAIAQKHGISLPKLRALNPNVNLDHIKPEQNLILSESLATPKKQAHPIL